MSLRAVELRRIGLPLVAPFRTSFGTQHARDILLVRVRADEADGWGECVALPEPSYSSEFVDGAQAVLERFLAPPVLADGRLEATAVAERTAHVHGHRMAKAALEMAVLDAELRAAGESLAARLGAVRATVPSGVSVGIADSIPALLETVGDFLDQGYVRIKLKIEPGWDVEPVAAVREAFGDIPLQVDANAAYALADAPHLARLDEFDLLLIEQPLGEEAVLAHADLAKQLRTPVCLDESITSAAGAADAIRLGAAAIVNIKAGRVGGYLEARAVHDVCVERGVPVWCGGMVESGLGRAANIALAALPGCTLPGDVSASDRFYRQDIITEPFVLADGHVAVPSGPGLGVEVDAGFLDEVTTAVREIRDS